MKKLYFCSALLLLEGCFGIALWIVVPDPALRKIGLMWGLIGLGMGFKVAADIINLERIWSNLVVWFIPEEKE